MGWSALGMASLGWSALVVSVELEAVRRSLFRRLAPLPGAARATRVLIVRPCAGREPWLDATLPSLASARRSFAASCRFAVADATDAALPAARDAAARLAAKGLDASVILTSAQGPNRKAAQLAAVIAAERAPFEVVLVADSDVDLDGTDLDALVAPLAARADLAAVWAPPVEIGREDGSGTFADRASASLLGASLHAFPILAGLDPAGLVGKLFAVKRGALAEVGGFEALVGYLGEDMELARRLRARGHAVEAAPIVARSRVSGRTWRQVEARIARWITVIRAQRPALLVSYPALFFATLPIVLLAAASGEPSPLAAALVAVAVRLLVAAAATSATGARVRPRRLVLDALLADGLLAAAFTRALRSRDFVWRDVALTVDRGGRLRSRGAVSGAPAEDRVRLRT